jgi:hypothetical protein
MTAIKIKQNPHSLIDNLEDDHILELINETITQIMKDKKLKWDLLSEEERKSILRGLKQLENGEYVYYEEMKRESNEWKRK